MIICHKNTHLQNDSQQRHSHDRPGGLFKHVYDEIAAADVVVLLAGPAALPLPLLHQLWPPGVVQRAAGDRHVGREVQRKVGRAVVFCGVDPAAVELWKEANGPFDQTNFSTRTAKCSGFVSCLYILSCYNDFLLSGFGHAGRSIRD